MGANFTSPRNTAIDRLEDAVTRFMNRRQKNDELSSPADVADQKGDRVKIIGSDLLLSLMAFKLISGPQFRAGREWQSLMVKVELQGYKSIDWSIPIYSQHVYQECAFNERQEDAFDRRAAATAAVGVDARNALDRMLAEGSYNTGWYGIDGIDRLCDLLTDLAQHFDFHTTGIDDGYSNERGDPETQRLKRDAFMRRLKRDQPWLFSRIRTSGRHGPRY